MEWIGMIGIGLVGMVIAVLLRQYKPEYAVFVSLAVGVLIIGMLCSQLLPVFNEMKEMLSQANLSLEYIGIFDKKLGRLLFDAAGQRCLPRRWRNGDQFQAGISR